MGFVGSVNVLPYGVVGQQLGSGPLASNLFIRPHDLDLHLSPQPDSVPGQLRRLTHMGRDLQAELILEGGDVVMVVLRRERLDYASLNPGDCLHITSRMARTFEPDYAI